jgi:hypothetical protein
LLLSLLLMQALKDGLIYSNVHSLIAPACLIRGNLHPAAICCCYVLLLPQALKDGKIYINMHILTLLLPSTAACRL